MYFNNMIFTLTCPFIPKEIVNKEICLPFLVQLKTNNNFATAQINYTFEHSYVNKDKLSIGAK